MTIRKGARALSLPATLRHGGQGAGAAYHPRLRRACAPRQGGNLFGANRFRGRLYASWAGGIAARWQRKYNPGARPGFIFALPSSGTIERRVQTTEVHLHRHAHTSLVSPQFNLRVSTASAPTGERNLLPVTRLERTLVAQSLAAGRPPVDASGRTTSPSSAAALIEQRYRRVTTKEASAPARDSLRRAASPPSTDFVFRRGAQANEPGGRSAGRHEPPLARSAQVEPRTAPDGGSRGASEVAAAPRLDEDVLTEQVMQRMQKRLTAQRERMGRL